MDKREVMCAMYWKKKGCEWSERKHLQAQSCQKADTREEEAEETEIVTKRIVIQEAKKQRG
jgi:hypothetical protein